MILIEMSQNASCKLYTILFWPQCVKEKVITDTGMRSLARALLIFALVLYSVLNQTCTGLLFLFGYGNITFNIDS